MVTQVVNKGCMIKKGITKYTFLKDFVYKPMKRNSGVKKGENLLVVGVVHSYKVFEVTLMYGSQHSAVSKS